MPLPPADPIRVFISSPSDVADERRACLRAITLLNRRYAGLLRLEPVAWEEHFIPATVDFQTWINQTTPPWACELVVCVLWSRIGSPLSDAWPTRPDGTRYESGTVAEFEMTRPRAEAGPLPDLYMFVKTAAPPPAATAADMRRAAEAKDAVEAFIKRWFHQADGIDAPGMGSSVHPFTAGFNPFPSTDVFEEVFTDFLEWWLREKGWIDRPRSWDIERQGLPFVGLSPFSASHSAVFFGRDSDRRIARRLLIDADAAGLPYLLLAGGSGVGKSSLARAGVVADLCIDTPQEVWASAVMLASAEPAPRLAEALYAADCALAPHLAASLFPEAARLEPVLSDPSVAATVVTGVLDAMAAAQQSERRWERAPNGRLLLIVDQAEALLDGSAETAEKFVALLTALAATRRVWVVATLRLDRMGAFLASPALAPLVSRELRGCGPEGAEVKLAAPDNGAIRDIIKAPADAAGLTFEERDGHSLADTLRAEVAGQPDALPLLQHLLARLFRDGTIARWAEYEAIGRLPGAIAAAADAALASVDDAARAELRPLLLVLTAGVVEGDETAVISRPADRAGFTSTPARTALIAALLDARLLTVDGRDQMRVAHEALLRAWPRAREILSRDAEFIRLRERLRGPADEWRRHGTVLAPGPLLSGAETVLPALQAEDATQDLAAFVIASLHADRRKRRRRTMALAAVAAMFAVLAGVAGAMGWRASVAGAQAERNSARAERNFTAASGAVNGLIFDLAQDLRNQEGLSLASLMRILDRADGVVTRLLATSPDETRLLELQGAAKQAIADTLLSRGETSRALVAARASSAIYEQLRAKDPDNALRQRDVSVGRMQIGDILEAQGDRQSALAEYRAGLLIRERLASARPALPQLQHDVASGHFRIGNVIAAQGDGQGALAEYRTGLAILERLSAADPANTTWLRDLAVGHDTIGEQLATRGDVEEAIEEYRAALVIREDLSARDASNTLWQRDLTLSHEKIGDVLAARGDGRGALAEYRAGLGIRARLAARDPANTLWRSDLSFAHNKLGKILAAQGDRPAALAEYRESLAIRERLATEDPANGEWQRDMCVSLDDVGDLLAVTGDAAGALERYRAGLALIERLAAKDPSNARWQNDVSVSLEKVGDVLAARGDAPRALVEYRAGLIIRTRLVATDPTNTESQRNLSASREKVGDMLVAQGDRAAAMIEYRASLALREQLAARDPANSTAARDLSISHNKIGDILAAQGDRLAALVEYRAALAIRDHLTAQDASNADWQRDLVVSHNRIGEVLAAQGDRTGAMVEFRIAWTIIEKLAARDPTNTEWLRDIAVSHDKIGLMLSKQGDLPASLAQYRDGLSVRARLVDIDPTNPLSQHDLALNHDKVADILAALGDGRGALIDYRAALAISQRLCAAEPSNMVRQRDLVIIRNKIGDLLAALGERQAALVEYQALASEIEPFLTRDSDNDLWSEGLAATDEKIANILARQGDYRAAMTAGAAQVAVIREIARRRPADENPRMRLAQALNTLSWRALLARDWDQARLNSGEALTLAPSLTLLEANLAHADMFAEDADAARAIYLRNRGAVVQPARRWEDVIRQDFADLRQAGLTHPLMSEIEAAFTQPASPAPQAARPTTPLP